MFFKFVSKGILLSGISLFVYGSQSEPISFSTTSVVQIVPCYDCLIPGKECDSYVITNTDKICLDSSSSDDEMVKEEYIKTRLHEQANNEDTYNLQTDIEQGFEGMDFVLDAVDEEVLDKLNISD